MHSKFPVKLGSPLSTKISGASPQNTITAFSFPTTDRDLKFSTPSLKYQKRQLRRMLRCSFAVKLQKCFLDEETSPSFSSTWIRWRLNLYCSVNSSFPEIWPSLFFRYCRIRGVSEGCFRGWWAIGECADLCRAWPGGSANENLQRWKHYNRRTDPTSRHQAPSPQQAKPLASNDHAYY